MTRRHARKKNESPALTLARKIEKAIIAAWVKHNTHHDDPRWRCASIDLDILTKIAEELLRDEPCLPSPSTSTPPSTKRRVSRKRAASSTSPSLLQKLPSKVRDLDGQQLFPQVSEILTTEAGTSDS